MASFHITSETCPSVVAISGGPIWTHQLLMSTSRSIKTKVSVLFVHSVSTGKNAFSTYHGSVGLSSCRSFVSAIFVYRENSTFRMISSMPSLQKFFPWESPLDLWPSRSVEGIRAEKWDQAGHVAGGNDDGEHIEETPENAGALIMKDRIHYSPIIKAWGTSIKKLSMPVCRCSPRIRGQKLDRKNMKECDGIEKRPEMWSMERLKTDTHQGIVRVGLILSCRNTLFH